MQQVFKKVFKKWINCLLILRYLLTYCVSLLLLLPTIYSSHNSQMMKANPEGVAFLPNLQSCSSSPVLQMCQTGSPPQDFHPDSFLCLECSFSGFCLTWCLTHSGVCSSIVPDHPSENTAPALHWSLSESWFCFILFTAFIATGNYICLCSLSFSYSNVSLVRTGTLLHIVLCS